MKAEEIGLLCPLIGLQTRIVSSSSKELIGIEGKVIDETKNTIIVERDSKIRRIMKKGNSFEVSIQGKKVKIEGDKIMFRPEEKAKSIKLIRGVL